MTFTSKVVEVSGMNDDTHLAQEIDRQIFVGSSYRDAHHDVPSAFNLQPRARGTACELGIEFRKIHAQTIEKNGLDLFALIQQHRGGELHRERSSRDRCRRRFRGALRLRRPFLPGRWSLPRQASSAGGPKSWTTPLSVKVSASALLTKLARGAPSCDVVEKNFIHDQRQPVVAARRR